jgi:hypothetical protein
VADTKPFITCDDIAAACAKLKIDVRPCCPSCHAEADDGYPMDHLADARFADWSSICCARGDAPTAALDHLFTTRAA